MHKAQRRSSRRTWALLFFLVALSALSTQAGLFTLTQTPGVNMNSYSGPTLGLPGTPTAYDHCEMFWNFTSLPGWLSGSGGTMKINSVTITVTLGSYGGSDAWGSSFINYAGAQAVSLVPNWGTPGYIGQGNLKNPGSNNDGFDVAGIYTIRAAGTGGQPFSQVFTPGVDGFTSALVMNDGGEFWTRVGRSGGNFTLASYQVQIDADPIPEPVTFALIGSALVGLSLLRRRK